MKRLIIIMVLALVTGCASKQKSYEFDKHTKFDSINFRSEKTIMPALRDTIYIDNPCDSLTGHLKPFSQTYITPQGKIVLEGKNNSINARIDLKEVEQSEVYDSRIGKENNIQIKTEYKKVIVQDWRMILALVTSLILNGLLIYQWLKKVI